MAAALAWVLGAPTLAHAQQGGLFPLAPIQRQRVPCAAEDPVYRLYRQEYFGYHPTCWRKFPAGWGCPSPEAPNAAEAFRLLPRDEPPPEMGEEGEDQAPEGARPDGAMPPDQGAPGGRDTQPAPNNLPPLPSGERSPFELDPKPATPPATDPTAPTGPLPSPVTPPPGAALPPISDPATTPTVGGRFEPADLSPVLALPDPTANPTTERAEMGTLPPQERPTASATTPVFERPAQAPRRQGFFSRLFGGRTIRR